MLPPSVWHTYFDRFLQLLSIVYHHPDSSCHTAYKALEKVGHAGLPRAQLEPEAIRDWVVQHPPVGVESKCVGGICKAFLPMLTVRQVEEMCDQLGTRLSKENCVNTEVSGNALRSLSSNPAYQLMRSNETTCQLLSISVLYSQLFHLLAFPLPSSCISSVLLHLISLAESQPRRLRTQLDEFLHHVTQPFPTEDVSSVRTRNRAVSDFLCELFEQQGGIDDPQIFLKRVKLATLCRDRTDSVTRQQSIQALQTMSDFKVGKS